MGDLLDLSNKKLKYIYEIPSHIKALICDNNELEELPELPPKLTYLYCNNNKLKSLPKLPETLNTLVCYNNLLTTLPKLPKEMVCLEAENNLLTNMPKIPKTLLFRFEGNPFSKNLYNISELNPKNISIENEEYYLTLKKGTILFHNMSYYKNYSEMYLGFKVDGKYILSPDHQTYFFLHPFCLTYGEITTINVLQNDVRIFLGLLPSKIKKYEIGNRFYQSCDNVEYESKLKTPYQCLIDKYRDIHGWITFDGYPKPGFWHGENCNFLKYYKYVSYYKDIDGYIDRPEVQLYPRRKKVLKDVVVNTDDYISYIDKHSDEFNYKTICMVNNSNFNEYKKCIDSLLSKDGLCTNIGTFKAVHDKTDGIYYLKNN